MKKFIATYTAEVTYQAVIEAVDENHAYDQASGTNPPAVEFEWVEIKEQQQTPVEIYTINAKEVAYWSVITGTTVRTPAGMAGI